MISTRAKHETEILIDGPSGQLELLLTTAKTENPQQAFGIVCHPHPLYGGSLDNKVVTTLAKVFQEINLNTIRFNFRGVGKSVGQFDEGKGEVDDLLAVIEWVKKEKNNTDIWLAGFSFGAYIATLAAAKFPFKALITVAPPVEHFDMENIAPLLMPWILAQGEKDEVVPAEKVFAWAEKQNPKPTIIKFPEATHFFHGQLTALRTQLKEVLERLHTVG